MTKNQDQPATLPTERDMDSPLRRRAALERTE